MKKASTTYFLLSLLFILALGLSSYEKKRDNIVRCSKTASQKVGKKLDSVFLLQTNFVQGSLVVFAKVEEKTGKGFLYAKYYKNNKLLSHTQTRVTLANSTLDSGIVFKANKVSFSLDQYCIPVNNQLFFCIKSTTCLACTNLYIINLEKGKLHFLNWVDDKIQNLVSEGYWVVQKNQKRFVRIQEYRNTRQKNVTTYLIQGNRVIKEKELHNSLLKENTQRPNNTILQICKSILANKI